MNLRPYGLRTEQRTEPLGVDERRPRLSWKLECDRRGATQSGYRVTAAERAADLDDPDRLVWDSGWRAATDGLLVPWDGPVLRSGTRYHWRVRVWDETGAPAGVAGSWFETGLLHREDWTAVWVGRDEVALPHVDPPSDGEEPSFAPPPLYLRREFELRQPVARARLYATARGVYEPRLNGTRVGDAELAPGWTEYHHRLQSNITWGQRGNFVAVPTDCPQRDERLGWLADAQIFAPTATRNADVSAFFARWLRDVVDGQTADGAFRDVAPVISVYREAAPAWGDAGVILPWLLWRTYGDRRVLERSFAAMVAWVAHIRRHNPDLRWRHRTGNSYGDWLQVGVTTPRDLLATAYFAHSARIVAEAAEVLGHQAVAAEHRTLHAAIRAAFIESFVDEDGRVLGDTQTGYLLALAFGLLPDALVPAAVDHLAADVEKRDYRLTTGFVGVALLCPVLAEHGRADLAYRLLHQEEYPSWGYSIRHGATTIWERWDGWTDTKGFQASAMNSFNHYSLGSVGDWLFGRVAGIDQAPGSVAYRELLLRPLPGGRLTWARAEQETARGRVACGWRIAGGRLTVTVAVPPGSTAVLEVPTPDPASVREGGAAPADQPGVVRIEPSPAGATLWLASGRYTVSATAPDTSAQEIP